MGSQDDQRPPDPTPDPAVQEPPHVAVELLNISSNGELTTSKGILEHC